MGDGIVREFGMGMYTKKKKKKKQNYLSWKESKYFVFLF